MKGKSEEGCDAKRFANSREFRVSAWRKYDGNLGNPLGE
jgi:hypothetical protein